MRHMSPPRPHTLRDRERERDSLLTTTHRAPAPQRPSVGTKFDVRALERPDESAGKYLPTGKQIPHHPARERLCALRGGTKGRREDTDRRKEGTNRRKEGTGGQKDGADSQVLEGTDRQMLKDLLAIARAQQVILEVKEEQKVGGE